jgi:hypothetical protein
MKLEPEQRNQFILLSVLVLLVLGFGAYRMLGARTSAGSPAGTVSGADKSVKTTVAENSNPESQQTDAQAAVTIVSALPVRDPFEPQVLPVQEKSTTQTKSRPMARFPLIAREPGMSLPIMPSFDSQPMNVGPMPMPEVEDPSKDLKVTGVIEGDTNLAVIRSGDTRHIVREGQSINGKYVIKAITRNGVRVTRNGRSYLLVIGSAEKPS